MRSRPSLELGCGEPEPAESERELILPAPEDGITMVEEAARALKEAAIDVSDLGPSPAHPRRRLPHPHRRARQEDGEGPETGEFAATDRETAGARR